MAPIGKTQTMLIAQLSDLHLGPPGWLLGGRVDTAACLNAALDRLLALEPAPDVVVLSGDLTDGASAEEYRYLRRLLQRLIQPYFLMAGNHDRRATLLEVFGGQPCLPVEHGFLHYAADLGGHRMLLLDTLDEGREEGALCPERLGWLQSELDAHPNTPTLVFLHHPPFACGIAGMDAIGLKAPQGLERMIGNSAQVRLMACGHVHRSIFTTWAGKPTCICPSPAQQIHLDLSGDACLRYTLEPGGFLLHQLTADAVVSHVVANMPFLGPYDYD